jgi:hypothetical protein
LAEIATLPHLVLRLERAGLGDESVERLARSLSNAIGQGNLPTARITQLPDPSADGARGDAFTLGALVLAVGPVFVEQAIGIIRDWCGRPGAKPVKITVKVQDREITSEYDASRITPDEITTLVKALRAAAN